PAVLIFIIISGFVITHLTIERPEPYRIYLLRRFMRIFPLFAVACVMGFLTLDLLTAAMARSAWANDPDIPRQIGVMTSIAESGHKFLVPHVLIHLTMLHGVVSQNLLPWSDQVFDSPAWSLSLEWQFYLLAPLVILLACRPRGVVWLAVITVAAELAYGHG